MILYDTQCLLHTSCAVANKKEECGGEMTDPGNEVESYSVLAAPVSSATL